MNLGGYGAAYTVCSKIMEAVVAELHNTDAGPPARYGVTAGVIPWDNCDQCGTLTVSALRYFLSDQFPIEVSTTNYGPGTQLGIDIIVQMIRCAPVPQGQATSPTVQAQDNMAHTVFDDAWAVMCATTTLLVDMVDTDQINDWMVRSQMIQGPAGACVGSDLVLVVAVDR